MREKQRIFAAFFVWDVILKEFFAFNFSKKNAKSLLFWIFAHFSMKRPHFQKYLFVMRFLFKKSGHLSA